MANNYVIDFPKLKDTDMADLQKYTSDLGNALSRELLKFNSQLANMQNDIEDLEAETVQNDSDLEETKTFIANSMKTLQTEGTSIHVEDSADYWCALKIEGKSEQVQTETSPSPDYPSQIENVSGDLEIKVIGKNLFNKNDIKAAVYIDVNGAEQISTYWDTSDYMDIETGNKLTYQGISQVGGFGYNAFYDKDKNFISSFKSVVGGETKNIPENAKYVRFCFVRAVNDIQTFQLELGEIATTYEAYKEQSVTFPFAEGQKLMEDGYLGENGIVNKRKQVTVSGLSATFEDAKENGAYMCNVKEGGTLSGKTITFEASVTNAIVEYELEEEETTAYTTEQQTAKKQIDALKTYRTVTNISNNQNTNMKLTYKKDLQTQFQELETMLLESGV